MSKLYAISGVTGMTGNELVRQILVDGSADRVLGFDNFYASSIETVSDHINAPEDFEIRGEVFMPKKSLERLNKEREQTGFSGGR